jgi:stress response protein YsnF
VLRERVVIRKVPETDRYRIEARLRRERIAVEDPEDSDPSTFTGRTG